MSTRATIKFSNEYFAEKYYVYRHCDGFPEVILADLQKLIDEAKGRWSDPELGMIVSLFISMNYDYNKQSLPDYEITETFHGDESYTYYFNWNNETKKWDFGILK